MKCRETGFIACSNSANPFIDYIASLSDVLDATSFSADQINHAFCFAVETSVDHTFVIRLMNYEFSGCLHECAEPIREGFL